MKMLSIILAWLAAGFIVVQGWSGPLYTMYDSCPCGECRAWLEFEESPALRDMKLFLTIEKQGDPKHQHQFCDPRYDDQYLVLGYVGVGLGLLSAATLLYHWKHGLPVSRL
jgi:hypothetical protein